MKIKIKYLSKHILQIILIIINLYCITDFLFAYSQPSHEFISWVALLVSLSCPAYLVVSFTRYYGQSLALLIYLILTQFGTCIVVYAIPVAQIVSRGYYNTDWIYSSNYPLAVQLGIIATIFYTFSVVWFGRRQDKKFNVDIQFQKNLKTQVKSNSLIVYIGIFLICLVLLYTIIMAAIGEINLFGSYGQFLTFSQKNYATWGMMLILYATGFIFVVASGNKKQIKVAIILFSLMAFILLVTGNKGEVFYAVLAALGVYLTRQQKINTKLIVFIAVAFFIIIPSVSSLRVEGVLYSLKSIGVSLPDPFIEIGGQIRLSVFVLDELQAQSREYLYGFSYYNPIVNIINRIIPLVPRLELPASFNFDTNFANMGFSQVTESYANFGLLGVMMFFTIQGYIVSKFDSINISNKKRALYGGWLVIFINMTRNVFAFVVGQMLIVYLIWSFSSFFGEKIKIKRLR